MTTGTVWWLWAFGAVASGQGPAGDVLTEIDQLDVLGRVLYVAAHPDDENTRLIHWLGRERGLRTAYLSMTRGGGGQNLIGAEQAEQLGVLRTGELLAARAIDGGEQFFTRMRDFGYSKSPEETLAVWGREDALDDVVRVIRTFRPDIVVTRFGPEGTGHGHHTASAQLAAEAFALAADPTYETEGLVAWQARRLLHNRSTWRRPKDEPIPDDWMAVDVGTYDPRSGASGGEVAAWSRTQHKSQGFGSAPRVGPLPEYFTVTAGVPLDEDADPFGGLGLDWSRVAGGAPIARRVAKLRRTFDPRSPAASLDDLARLHASLDAVDDPFWRSVKREAVERLMQVCAGLYLTARTDVVAAEPGGAVTVELTAVARTLSEEEGAQLRGVRGPDWLEGWNVTSGPISRQPMIQDMTLTVDLRAPYSRPAWLQTPPTATQYTVSAPGRRTIADEPPASVVFDVEIAGVRQAVSVALLQGTTDRVRGEVLRPFEVLPSVTATFDARGVLVPQGGSVTLPVTLHAPTFGPDDEPLEPSWDLVVPSGVAATASPWPVTLTPDAPVRTIDLTLTARRDAERGPLTIRSLGESEVAQQAHRIAYDHVPERTVLSEASIPVVPLALRRGEVRRVGYLPGSGDAVPDVLRTVGYDVEILAIDQLDGTALDRFDAVVFGVRAYNTRPELLSKQAALMDYVNRGGTLVVQYNTSRRWSTLSDQIGPAPLQVGRDRVTDETAAVRFVDPDHPVVSGPNRLTAADFDGWVQERGLYFAESWDDAYTPLFAMNDPDQDEQLGSTVVARHGRGTFVYTGLSFFRQLPAGVPGAMRLFANLLAGEG